MREVTVVLDEGEDVEISVKVRRRPRRAWRRCLRWLWDEPPTWNMPRAWWLLAVGSIFVNAAVGLERWLS